MKGGNKLAIITMRFSICIFCNSMPSSTVD